MLVVVLILLLVLLSLMMPKGRLGYVDRRGEVWTGGQVDGLKGDSRG